MFTIYLVFGRRRVRVGDDNASDKGEPVSLLDAWFPDPRPGETADDRLQVEGLPKTQRFADFCFASKKVVDDAAGLVPPALPFTFTLTMSDGERVHCFCLRTHRPQEDSSHRVDVGGDWIETSVFVSRNPFHRLFPAALQICRVRRALDRPAFIHFLQALYSSVGKDVIPKGPIAFESPCLNVVAKYEFPSNREPRLDSIFDCLKPQALQFALGAILLERRVCLVGRDERRLSEVAYALTHLACGEMPLKGYCHNFVPVLPGSLLEYGLGNPAPYLVGILRVNLKATDSIKGLGDIVIVDLDSKIVKISPNGAPIIPLGVDISSEPHDGVQSMKPANDMANPWQDVCGPFSKDLAVAFSNHDVDLLLAAVRAVLLIVTVGKIGTHLEDSAIKLFQGQFRKTQIAASASSVNENSVSVMLGSRGYLALRAQLVAQESASRGPERANALNIQAVVSDLTGNSAKGRPDKITKTTVQVMKRSFDAWAFAEGIRSALKARLSDCQGRNWKHAYKSLALLNLLVRMGSELAVADVWDDLGTLFELTRFSLNGTVGVPSRVADLVQKRALELYTLAVDLPMLRFSRSFVGHTQIRQMTRQKMQQDVVRLPIGKDLPGMLEACAPEMLVEPDVEDSEPDSFPRHGKIPPPPPPIHPNRPISLDSGMGIPPPPPPVPHNISAPPPPPPPQKEELLLDLDSIRTTSITPGLPKLETLGAPVSESSNPFDDLVNAFESVSSPSRAEGVEGRVPPRTPVVISPGGNLVASSPRTPSPAVSKLMAQFEPKHSPTGRPDTTLVTAFEGASPSPRGAAKSPVNNASAGSRVWPPAKEQSVSQPAAPIPPRPARAAPLVPSQTVTNAGQAMETEKSTGSRPAPPPPPPASTNVASMISSGPPPGITRATSPTNNAINAGATLSTEDGTTAISNGSPVPQGPPGVRRKVPPPPGVKG